MGKIKNLCRLLVEEILNENYLSANERLSTLLEMIQSQRENRIQMALIKEDEDEETDDTGDEAIDSDEDGEEMNAGDDDIGDDVEDGSEDEDENAVGQEKLDEMKSELVNLNYELNKAKIKKLYNLISTLKTILNSQDIDKDSMEYVELDTTLAFYSQALEELQQQTMPGIDGEEQDTVNNKIDTIFNALNELKEKVSNLSGEESSDEETEDAVDDESEDEDAEEEETEDEDEEEESEEPEDEEESEEGEEEGSDEEEEEESEEEEG